MGFLAYNTDQAYAMPLGGIASNYNTNFWSHEKNVVVVEADEYDRSFLKLAPNIAVVTAVDPEHLEI